MQEVIKNTLVKEKEKEGDKQQLEKLMKELKNMRNKLDNLELENTNLKKSVFELNNKLAISNNTKPDPFISILNTTDDNTIKHNPNDIDINMEDNANVKKVEFYAATRNNNKSKSIIKPKLFNMESELIGHNGAVYVVKYSWDGKYLASGSFDKTLRIWDLELQKEIACFNQHRLNVVDLDFNKQNQILASASFDANIRLFDIINNKLTFNMATKGFAQCVQFSGIDSQLIIAGTSRKYLSVFDISSSEKPILEVENDSMINSLQALEYDNNIILTGDSKGLIKTWDIRKLYDNDGKALPINICINDNTNKPISYICKPINNESSKILGVNAYDNINRIYKLNNGNELNMTHSLQGYKNLNWPIRCSMLSVDKKLNPIQQKNDLQWHLFATGSADPHAYVYLIGPGEDDAQLLQRLDGHSGRIYDVSFNPNSTLPTIATASADCTIKIWNVNLSSK